MSREEALLKNKLHPCMLSAQLPIPHQKSIAAENI